MTDSQQERAGLPTAAYKVTAEREHLDSDIEVVMKNRPQHNRKENDQVDELVRRKDVKALIIEKIEHVEGHPVDEKIATEQSKILQELLEELEK